MSTPGLIHSLKMAGGGGVERLYLGCETGEITVLLHLGGAHLVKAASLTGHTGRVTSLEADQELLVSASQDTTARLWSLSKGTLVRELVGHQSPVSVVSASLPLTVLFSSHVPS